MANPLPVAPSAIGGFAEELDQRRVAAPTPCGTATLPDLRPCPELLDTLRARQQGLDQHIDDLVRTREVLGDYITITEQSVA